jgi:hypothetical protein
MRAMVHEDILNIIPAEGRLTKLAFQADENWDTYPRSEYTCASCGEKVGFSLRDLDKHAYSDRTNLSEGDAAAFTAVAAKRFGEANSFLDFYCPGCVKPRYVFMITRGSVAVSHMDMSSSLSARKLPADRTEYRAQALR